MTLLNSIRIALVALRLNAFRSFLTMLGIIIGIASVIVMVSVSSGAKMAVENFINSLGTNMLMIRPGASMFGGRRSEAGTDAPFTERDVKTLRKEFDFIDGISGSLNGSAPIIAGNNNWTTQVTGVHADYLMIRGWNIEQGRNFTDREVKAGGKVAILGQTVVRNLFKDEPALGARIRIKNVPFRVIGTLESKGQASMGRDQDDLVLIPISTARMRVSGRTSRTVFDDVGTIMVSINKHKDIKQAQRELQEFLRRHRKIAPGAQDDFSVNNLAEFIQARNETQNTLGLLLAATGAIALVVGGIGIMNIMLVSVTERTKEIGLRLAMGARRKDILTQFLVEAITLCMVGSLVGVFIGLGSDFLISRFSELPILVNVPIIFVAILSAACVGIFFGFYPARKASLMNPIDALRYE
jgi:putative ABC transport system permease protein